MRRPHYLPSHDPQNACSLIRSRIYTVPYLSAAATSPLTILRSSNSFVNSRLKTSSSETKLRQHATRASFGVISPSVWIRSSNLEKRGWGTMRDLLVYDLEVLLSIVILELQSRHTLVTGENDMRILQKMSTEHVGECVILLVEGKDRGVWGTCRAIN